MDLLKQVQRANQRAVEATQKRSSLFRQAMAALKEEEAANIEFRRLTLQLREERLERNQMLTEDAV